MQTIERKNNLPTIRTEFSVTTTTVATQSKTTSCLQIRQTLDLLFDGDSPLEDATTNFKQNLFGHLETCGECCRSFDVRARMRVRRVGAGIY